MAGTAGTVRGLARRLADDSGHRHGPRAPGVRRVVAGWLARRRSADRRRTARRDVGAGHRHQHREHLERRRAASSQSRSTASRAATLAGSSSVSALVTARRRRSTPSPTRHWPAYVDALLGHGVPASGIVLAALGPRVLRLAADRTAGAIPYLVTPEHTRQARELLGAGPLLAPEHKAVLDGDLSRGARNRTAPRPQSVSRARQLHQQPAPARLHRRGRDRRRQRPADRRARRPRRAGAGRGAARRRTSRPAPTTSACNCSRTRTPIRWRATSSWRARSGSSSPGRVPPSRPAPTSHPAGR